MFGENVTNFNGFWGRKLSIYLQFALSPFGSTAYTQQLLKETQPSTTHLSNWISNEETCNFFFRYCWINLQVYFKVSVFYSLYQHICSCEFLILKTLPERLLTFLFLVDSILTQRRKCDVSGVVVVFHSLNGGQNGWIYLLILIVYLTFLSYTGLF